MHDENMIKIANAYNKITTLTESQMSESYYEAAIESDYAKQNKKILSVFLEKVATPKTEKCDVEESEELDAKERVEKANDNTALATENIKESNFEKFVKEQLKARGLKLESFDSNGLSKFFIECELLWEKLEPMEEAEITSDEEFTEYANTVLKKAHGGKFDEDRAKKVINGLLKDTKGDYGQAIGKLTSSLGG